MNADQDSFELDDDLRALDARLREALRVDAPPHLADRIFEACVEQAWREGLNEQAARLEEDLARVLRCEAPADLADRVFAATADRVGCPAVAGRIGLPRALRFAAAAAIALGVGAMTWLMFTNRSATEPRIAPQVAVTQPSVDVDTMMAQLDRIGHRVESQPTGAIDAEILAVSLQVEQVLTGVEADVYGDVLAASSEQALDDIYLLEAQLQFY